MKNIYCVRPKGFNIGNEVIYLCARYFLKRHLGQDTNLINFPATNEYESSNKAGFTSGTIYEFNNYADAVVIVGGNIFENGKLDINLEAFNKLIPPLLVFSISRGRIYDTRGRLAERTDCMSDKIIRAIADTSKVVLSRDIATHDYLKYIGTRSTLGACPTLFLDDVVASLGLPARPKTSTVYLSVRTPDLISLPAAQRARVRTDIESIRILLKKRGYDDIRILCHDHRDIPFAASFQGLPYVYTEDVMEFIQYLQSARLMITYRLHSALPCLSLGTDFINISYDERALSMFETIGYQDWNINMMTTDVVAAVEDRIERMYELKRLRSKTRPFFRSMDAAISEAMLLLQKAIGDAR